MNCRRTTRLVAAVCGLLGLFAADAAAQAPTLTVSAVSDSVTIAWTPLAQATGYSLTVSGTVNVSVNLPASVTTIIVKAPAGSYRLRVRGLAGNFVGPESNEATVTVGGPPPPQPCGAAPAAPRVTANGNGLSVTLSWDNVPGAVGYQVQWSRSSGGTELTETTTSTSVTKYVGMAGTFFARVLVGTACGQATSNEVSFTLENKPGSGPRTPDPPPGVDLPAPAYAEAVVMDMGRRHAAELRRASNGECGPKNFDWLFLLVRELRQRDSRWGLNWKRGHVGELSTDIIAYNPSNGPDEGNGRVYLFDVIGAICEGNYPAFDSSTTAKTWPFRGDPGCAPGTYCTRWTIQPYLAAGFPADGRDPQ
jgi:hypothetical protein